MFRLVILVWTVTAQGEDNQNHYHRTHHHYLMYLCVMFYLITVILINCPAISISVFYTYHYHPNVIKCPGLLVLKKWDPWICRRLQSIFFTHSQSAKHFSCSVYTTKCFSNNVKHLVACYKSAASC